MEVWKDVKGYEGRYKVSNLSNVKGFVKYKKGKLLKSSIGLRGYKTLQLVDSYGKFRTIPLHRIIAITWLENPENKLK